MRRDLNMRKGKVAAQAAHAAMAFLTRNASIFGDWSEADFKTSLCPIFAVEVNFWLTSSFRKVCLYVNSEEELEAVHQAAIAKGLVSHMITDNGATEFRGVPTKTCIAIGPHFDEKFVGVTDHLPLF